jgi:hypothetical protein
MKPLSKRKLESYRRAETVARLSRAMVVHANPSPKLVQKWVDSVGHWMKVTGKIKYKTP